MIALLLIAITWFVGYFATRWFIKDQIINTHLHSRKKRRLKIKQFIFKNGESQSDKRANFVAVISASYLLIALYLILMALVFKDIFFTVLLLIIGVAVYFIANKFVKALAKLLFDNKSKNDW